MPTRLLAPLLVLAAGLGRQVWVGLTWIEMDRRVATPVASSMLDFLNLTLWQRGMGQLWVQRLAGTQTLDLHSLAGMLGWEHMDHSPDALLLVVLAFLVATQLLLFDLGRRLGSAWAGVAAALMLGIVPDVSWMARCWAPQVPQMFFLVAALHLLLGSRSFTRPLPSLGFVVVAALGASYSAMLTHNLLCCLALAGMVAGAWLRGVIAARGPIEPAPTSRWRTALLGVLATVLIAGAVWWLHLRHIGLAYHLAELQDRSYQPQLGRWHPAALSGYLRWIFWYGLEPPLAVATLAGVALFTWRGRGRAELWGWFLLPMVALSLVLKKNHYYVAGVYPALVLATALGASRLPRRWPGLVALGVVLGLAWVSWERASTAGWPDQDPVRMADGEQVFQSFGPPPLRPRPEPPVRREIALLRRHVSTSTCPVGQGFSVIPDVEGQRMALMLMSRDPCVRYLPNPSAPGVTWVLFEDAACTPGQAANSEPPEALDPLLWSGGTVVDEDLHAAPCLWLVRKPEPSR